MKIYTKTGDCGMTSLANGQRVEKADVRLEAYGTADELNSFVGLLRCHVADNPTMEEQLVWIQNKLFNLGAALAQAKGDWIVPEHVQTLEHWIDQMQVDLPPFQGFVLPGGSEAVSLCHICRTITRRLERQIVRINWSDQEQNKTDIFVCFVNRLSDFWFIFAQKYAKNEGTCAILWKK